MIAVLLLFAQIMRPVDKAALAKAPLEIIAKGEPGAKLEFDGQPVKTESPFPSVITAKVDAAPGRHRLSLTTDTGRHDIEISVGPGDGFAPYRAHPPAQTACTTCHGVSARGRFRFEGGCSNCHATAAFAKTHTHNVDKLAECGLCHNAHGSTAKAHLLRPREASCKICHE